MPLAIVTRDPTVLHDSIAREFGELLQLLIMRALSVPEDPSATLTADEIEVRYRETGPLDLNTSPLAIEIFANDSPGRRQLVNKGAAQAIADGITDMNRRSCAHYFLPEHLGDNSFVWILLGYGGFARINAD